MPGRGTALVDMGTPVNGEPRVSAGWNVMGNKGRKGKLMEGLEYQDKEVELDSLVKRIKVVEGGIRINALLWKF